MAVPSYRRHGSVLLSMILEHIEHGAADRVDDDDLSVDHARAAPERVVSIAYEVAMA
jgi:hypothetical protein